MGQLSFLKNILISVTELTKKCIHYHYQDAQNILRFRYDNANHKPALGFRDHKHTPEETLQAQVPTLQDVLNEIVNTYLVES